MGAVDVNNRCVRNIAVLICLTACGRSGFGDTDGGTGVGGDGGGSDAMPTTGPTGPRFLVTLDATNSLLVAGTAGTLSVAVEFQGSVTADMTMFSGQSQYQSTLVARFGASGTLLGGTVLDSAGVCNMRSMAMTGPTTIVAGIASGGGAVLGPCDVMTNREDPIVLEVDASGAPALSAHWVATGQNAQALAVVASTDGTLAIGGIYSSGLTVDGQALPAAQSDPNIYFTRFTPGGSAAWTVAIPAPNPNTNPYVAVDGGDTSSPVSIRARRRSSGRASPMPGSRSVRRAARSGWQPCGSWSRSVRPASTTSSRSSRPATVAASSRSTPAI